MVLRPDPTTCRECGTVFDLAGRNYYDNLCPDCMEKKDPKRTWPMCHVCSERVAPEKRDTMRVRGAARDPGTVVVPVHEACKQTQTRRGYAGP